MLHMVFYCKIGSEKGAFDVADVLNSVCDKLIHRHPHIYGDVEATTEEEVKANWEAMKLKERVPKCTSRCAAGVACTGEIYSHWR